MAMATLEPNWAELPKDLLHLIIDKLDLLSDYVIFSAVCVSWRSFAIHKRWHHLANTNPLILLMIPTKDSSKKKRSLYSVAHKKVYNYQLPVPYNRRCCGSSHGWLGFFNKTIAPTLYNPFLNKTIHLPRLDTIFDDDLTIPKLVLSANPALTPNDYVVATIYSGYSRLAFMKAGDKYWTYIDYKTYPLYDVIFYKGRCLAVDNSKAIISVDVFNNQVKKITPDNDKWPSWGHTYLVESSTGDLMMVQRIFYKSSEKKYDYMTRKFEVCKLAINNQSGMVIGRTAVKSLGEETLFLGDNYSMSILASKYNGLKPNSIYYTDDYIYSDHGHGPRDTGIFSLQDGSCDQHYVPDPSQLKRMPRPVWIVPTLQGFGM